MKRLSTLFFSVLILFSCQKEIEMNDKESTLEFNTKDYIIATEGSYWVYENYTVDVNGVEELLPELDTIKCLGYEELNGEQYIKYYKSYNPLFHSYMRDSNGYVVDQFGKVQFTLKNQGEVFNSGEISGLLNQEVSVKNVNQDLSIEAGSFETVNVEAVYSYLDGSSFNACNEQEVRFNTYYTKGVGKVWIEYGYSTELINECKHRIRKLKSYHIAN